MTIAIVFLVSAAETTGATSAVCTGALDREIKMEELQGSLAVDGFSNFAFRLFWMSAVDFFQPECRTCNDDAGHQPVYDFDGSIYFDFVITFPAAGSIF